MIEETGSPPYRAPDRFHILVFQLETKNVEVLGHPVPTNRLRDDDDSSLYQPTQDHLRNRFAVILGDREQQFVAENIVLSLGEGSPRFDLDVVFLKECLRFYLLMERVCFDLVYCGKHLVDER